jgi:hypothetical protein
MEAICKTVERLKSWWYPPKKPEEVHLLDPREKEHDLPPSLQDLTKIIYYYKQPNLKKKS